MQLFRHDEERSSKIIALLKQQSRNILLKASCSYSPDSVWSDIIKEREKKGHAISSFAVYDWTLVLEAKHYPYRVIQKRHYMGIEVPLPLADKAQEEIKEFEQEAVKPLIHVPPRRSFLPLLFLLWSLLFLHGLRNGWFIFHLPSPYFPESSLWPEFFGLDAYKTVQHGEWWRAVTALAIHKDSVHITSNLIFGGIFIGLLCKRAGNGITFLSLLLASAFANICNAFFHHSSTISIGFSTAVFSSLGILVIFSCLDIFFAKKKKVSRVHQSIRFSFLPLGAGLALLAHLGSGTQENIDVAAHVWGFFLGILVGGLFWLLEQYIMKLSEHQQKLVQLFLGMSAFFIVLVCWDIGIK